jgi:hypothetical protein
LDTVPVALVLFPVKQDKQEYAVGRGFFHPIRNYFEAQIRGIPGRFHDQA